MQCSHYSNDPHFEHTYEEASKQFFKSYKAVIVLILNPKLVLLPPSGQKSIYAALNTIALDSID